MAESIPIPRLTMIMVGATIAQWLKQEGERVEAGTPVVEIETEKVVQPVEAPRAGILHIVAPPGTEVPVGEPCGLIAASLEEYQSLAGGAQVAAGASGQAVGAVAVDGAAPAVVDGERVRALPAARRLARELGVDISLVRGSGPEGSVTVDDVKKHAEAPKAPPVAETERVAISPVARKLAEDHGVNLSDIRGTGPGGRITKEDVMAEIERQTIPAPTPKAPASEGPALAIPDRRIVARTVPLAGLRKAISDHMKSSLQSTAQVTIGMDVDATELIRLRRQLVEGSDRVGVRVSYNDIIVRAVIRALREWPIFNATIDGNEIKYFENINMGIAVNIDDGLIVPVVHDVDKMSFVELSKAISEVVDKARNRRLTFEDLTGGTFTLSNVGAYPLTSFTPIINTPESAILAMAGIAEKPVVVNGEVVVRSIMPMSLTWDHCIADGVAGCEFVQIIKGLLEKPSVLLV